MNLKALKYFLDIESAIAEIEMVVQRAENNFLIFKNDQIIKRAAERDLEIIGEAINRLTKLSPPVELTNAKKIISLRNLIIHTYDAVDDELIWAILLKDIPSLKAEIIKLKG
jgi:uncharacterized protein with HEPN domain